MCTAASYLAAKDRLYFGRTLDYGCSYGESIVCVPRNFPFDFKYEKSMKNHYSLIGTAHVSDGYPLFYDCVNEKGLAMAGLNFVDNAVFHTKKSQGINVATFELVPFILGQCENLSQARQLLKEINITDDSFSEKLPASKLHWIISDTTGSLVIESVSEGVFIYENPVGVMTNDPPFPYQFTNLCNYLNLTAKTPENRFCAGLPLRAYAKGMGAIGLPGDLSSESRFVKAAFVLKNSKLDSEENAVSQFFHILNSVDQQRGSNEYEEGVYEITIYTSCIDCSRGIYYYTTYNNHQISAVDMHKENLDGKELSVYPMLEKENILFQN